MKKFLVSFTLFLLVLGVVCQSYLGKLNVLFVKNECFLINYEDTTILIDIDGNINTSELQQLSNALPPFQDINFITASHTHEDHQDLNSTISYLELSPETQFICPQQVYKLFEENANIDNIKDQINIIFSDFNSCIDTSIQNIHFKIIMTRHARDMFKDMQNLCLIFKLGGIKIFHSGDYWGDNIDSLLCNLVDENIDVAFLHYEFLLNQGIESGISKIINYLNPKYIVLMHIPIESSYMEEVINAKEQLKGTFNNILYFESYNEKVQFKINEDIFVDTLNLPPLLNHPLPDTSITINNELIYPIPEYTFIDKDYDTLSYNFTINDGSNLPGWLIMDTNKIQLYGTPTVPQIIEINVKAIDKESAFVSDNFIITVEEDTETKLLFELKNINDIEVYPNPSNNMIYIKSKSPLTGIKYIILNLSGILIQQDILANNKIDISKLSNGIYVMLLNTTENKIIKKTFIQKW